MTTIKVKFRPSTVIDREGTIYFQIIHKRKVRQLLTQYHISPNEWDDNRSMLKTNLKNDRSLFVESIRKRLQWDIERLTKIVHKLEGKGISYSADDVIDEFSRYVNEYTLFNFMHHMIVRLKQNGKSRTAETYTATLNSFKKFRNNEDIMLDNITSECMEAYEAWHRVSFQF